ncbi:conjugative transposon protein [Porphyromonas gingivalis SJD2]|uniref:hypothetical protein n=1 Tax=Porphyromonas gingivalis TaxID=837 RepID=UPI0003D1B8F6|nr:hypothetical protein [Porphyromonas gingivalis]ETA26877.1 conjugative transposon protein [Porphyromonas gingivalis SJD2]OWR80628.1 conjugative transposon protein [Porphyromonas gingivalis SJD5]
MYRIALAALLLYLLWLFLFLLYERKRRKKGAPKKPCQIVSEAEIIGKSRFKLSHSAPQVRSYPKGEAEAKKASTFAAENEQEPSEEPDNLPDIDEIPLTYESSDAPSFEEEEDEELPVSGKSEYATGIDFERVLEALSVIHRNASSIAERQRAGETLTELEGTRLMETLRSDKVRSSTIDDIVRKRFEELYSDEEA